MAGVGAGAPPADVCEDRVLDLYVGVAIVAALSAMLFALGLRAGRRLRPDVSTLLAVAVVGFLVAFVLRWSRGVLLAQIVPMTNAIVLADAVPPAAALLAGLAWARIPGGAGRRAVLVVPLLLVGVHHSYSWMLADPPPLANHWRRGVCVQTSGASCSPAAAATLLRAYGIATDEAEMARLCLTRRNGTSMLGLYRGLRLKTAGTPWRVEPFATGTADLRAFDGPAILSVGIPRGGVPDARYEQLWGWVPGVRHTVVAFGFRAGGAELEVGDPAIGREHWSVDDLHVLWQGEGLRLVRR